MIEITVDLAERSYPIAIGHGLLKALPELVRPLQGRSVALVSNETVYGLYGRAVEKALAAVGPVRPITVRDGERYKDRRSLAAIHDAMADASLGRDVLLVALGGGVVGDLAGFAAATWMRGVIWVQIPTTLLAMVDSSVGGKVGINHKTAKNLIGAFHQPKMVIADPAVLATLAPRERRSGAYEVLKCGIIGDAALFDALAEAPGDPVRWSRVHLESAIASSCRLKAEIVEKDEREDGLRRILNLGHTLGHALESVTSYRRFTHGEAVGWGLVAAAWIARRRQLLDSAGYDEIVAAVDRIGPRPRVDDLRDDALLAAVGRDKKAHAGRITFVLPTGIGRVQTFDDVTPEEVRGAAAALRFLQHGRSPAGG
jgi:3-dehydroquinate synthase